MYFDDVTTSNNDLVFGYNERYFEYRSNYNLVTGTMNSSAGSTIEEYHLAEDFGALPSLNQSFIEVNPDMARIKAVTSAKDFIADVQFTWKAVRPMPVYGIPGLTGHL